MSDPITWANGPGGGTPKSAANFNRITTATKQYVDGAGAINAARLGLSPNATAASNDAVLASAITQARAEGRPLYIPGTGTSPTGAYHISVPIDLNAGQVTVFGDLGTTWFVQDTHTAALLLIGGYAGKVSGLNMLHSEYPNATQGNGIEANDVAYWHISDLSLYQANTMFKDVGVNHFFSNLMENLSLKRFYTSAIKIGNGVGFNTGSCWNNIYINNIQDGVSYTSDAWVVDLSSLDESVWNQLNIEWCKPQNGGALLMNGSRAQVFNSLHIEQVHLERWAGTMIRSYFNTRTIINGLTVKYCDLAPTGSDGGGRVLVNAGAGGTVNVSTLWTESNSNTAGQACQLFTTDTDPASRVRFGDLMNDVFTTQSSGPGLRPLDSFTTWIPVAVVGAAATAWTNMPLADTELFGVTNNRNAVDLTRGTYARIVLELTVAGTAASKLRLQYSVDNGTTWGNAAADSTSAPIEVALGTAVGWKRGVWALLAAGAKADVLVRLLGSGGDGVADPAMRAVAIETR